MQKKNPETFMALRDLDGTIIIVLQKEWSTFQKLGKQTISYNY